MSAANGTVRRAAERYLSLGWVPVPIPAARGKAPSLDGWQTLTAERVRADIDALFPPGRAGNLGLLLGEPSGALVDVDLDCPQALVAGAQLLPATGWISGRAGNERSHYWYLIEGGVPATTQYRALDRSMLVELRSTGGQTVVPPSIHPSGESVVWHACDGRPSVVAAAELRQAVAMVAAAAMLAQHWPAEGGRHDAALALAGGLLRGGWAAERVRDLVAAVADAAGDSEREDRCRCVEATAARLFSGETATGWPALAEALRGDGQRVVRSVRQWLGIAGPRITSGRDNGTPAPPPDYHLTDTGNAQRVASRHGADLRYCHPWRQWLTWDGTRWTPDETGVPVRLVKDTQADLYRSTADTIRELGDVGDDEERKKELARLTRRLKHLLTWEDARKIAASLDLLRSEPGIPILPAQLDADPFLLNCPNGTLDLRTGTLRQHRREDYLTKLCRVEYAPAATCPTWHRFLDRVIASPAVRDYLQRVIGYCLTGDVREQALFFFHGAGANGKSTFLTAIREAMGDYAIQAVSELLLAKSNESHPTERADLFGRRFVCTIETDQGKAIAEALMKQLTGGDSIRARKMRQDFFEFQPTHKIILAANHKPAVRGTDHAVWRRIKLVPFTVTITDAEKDPTLPDKLRAEYPGILAWAVEGCRQWLAHGLSEPAEVRQATEDYQAEQDRLGQFISECCHVHRDARAAASLLLDEYLKWSGDRLMTPEKFGTAMKARGFQPKQSHGTRYYVGLMLHAPDEGAGTSGYRAP